MLESALRAASVVLIVITTDFLRSKYCLEELHWTCDEMQRRNSRAQQPQQRASPFMLVPIFYHDQDPIVGFGVDRFKQRTLTNLLHQHHAAASRTERAQWLDALLGLAKTTGIRQNTIGRYGFMLDLRVTTASIWSAPGI